LTRAAVRLSSKKPTTVGGRWGGRPVKRLQAGQNSSQATTQVLAATRSGESTRNLRLFVRLRSMLMKNVKFAGWDVLLIPSISILTVCGMLLSLESAATKLLSHQVKLPNCGVCLTFDPTTGVHGKAYCECEEARPEIAPVTYRFNDCGHRMDIPCGQKPAGVFRIVLVGSSVAMGMHVPANQTIGSNLSRELSVRTGHKVEVYNAAIGWGPPPRSVPLRMDEVLAQKPDLILWVVTPWDIQQTTDEKMAAQPEPAVPAFRGPFGQTRFRIAHAFDGVSLSQGMSNVADSVHEALITHDSGILLEHLIYQSPIEFCRI
jgi:hypothetical protein